MKKRICLALALLLLFCWLPISAVASEMTYEVVISPQYEEVGRFNEGYAPVKIDGKWGYINESNDLVVQPKYDWAGKVSESVAVTLILGDCEDGFGESTRGYYAHLIDMKGMDKSLYLGEDEYIEGPIHLLSEISSTNFSGGILIAKHPISSPTHLFGFATMVLLT